MHTRKVGWTNDHSKRLTRDQRRFFRAWKRAHTRKLQAAPVKTVTPITDAPSLRIRSAA
jgi:hypothetical protein